jgi:hypothetical protein
MSTRVQINIRIDKALADSLTRCAKEVGLPRNVFIRNILADAMGDSEGPSANADETAARVRQLQVDLRKATAVLLVSAGKAHPDHAREWVRSNLTQASSMRQRPAA